MVQQGQRVLQVLGSSAGGVVRHVAQVAAGARARGHDVRVAGPSDLHEQLSGGGRVPVARLEIADRPGKEDAVVLRRLRTLARHADVVHAHGLRAGALAVLATRSLGAERPAVVVTLHNMPVGGSAVRAVARGLEELVGRGADVVLGVSGDLVELARLRGARHTARALVPAPPRPVPAHTPEQVRAALGVAGDAALLVTVGRLAPQKGLDLLLDAAALLEGGPREVVWVVAGDGPLLGDLERQAADEALPVRFLGRREDVADLLGAADVVVSTATWEGQPIAVQEALHLGCAVVATDVGGTGEVTGTAAELVPNRADSVADAVRRLLADPDRVGHLRDAARSRAGELPTIEDTLDQLEEWWDRAARARDARRAREARRERRAGNGNGHGGGAGDGNDTGEAAGGTG